MRESSFSDGCHAVGDGDGGRQAAAIRESITADGGHAVGDGDGCQAAAFLESKVPMDVTLLGMVTEVRPMQPSKAS